MNDGRLQSFRSSNPRQRDRSATLASAKKCPPVKETKEKGKKVSKDDKKIRFWDYLMSEVPG